MRRPIVFFVDASQCVSSRPWSTMVPCITTTTVLYSFSADAVVNSHGQLAVMGHPVAEVPPAGLKEGEISDLVGESMFLPNIGSLMLAIWLNPFSPWWCQEQAAESRQSRPVSG